MAIGLPAASDERALPAELLALRRSAGALIISETDPANEHVAEHDPVTHKAVQWIFEGSGAIFFKLEMKIQLAYVYLVSNLNSKN